MIKSLSFGQYIHKESIIHEIDTRLKIIYIIILSMAVFLINNFSKMLIFSFFIMMILILTKINFSYFIRSLRPFYLIFIFILLMYLIFSPNQINQGFITIWRFLILVFLSMTLTFTTTISSLIIAIEMLIMPISFLGIKPRNAATMISVAVRFVPVMFMHFERQREAMLARLANFRKFWHVQLILINLFEKMLKSASSLSDAMQSRLYNENAKNHKTLRLDDKDYASIILVSIFLIIIY